MLQDLIASTGIKEYISVQNYGKMRVHTLLSNVWHRYMHQYDFIANFDADEMLFPGRAYNHLTLPELLANLDASARFEKPNAYTFERVFFPDAEDLNDLT